MITFKGKALSSVAIYTYATIFSLMVNLTTQLVFISFLGESVWTVYLSMLFGTVVGMFAKFILDSYFVFHEEVKCDARGVRRLFTYSFMAIVPTLIFWGFELLFEYFFSSVSMRFFGATIGFILGAILKYNLDKRYVFNGN
ncbi:GtrA-like protein [Vibrio chagasii]|nr:GtrA-like protein [Vibrio chagasii]